MKKVIITLTDHQAFMLRAYLIMSRKNRKDAIDTWKSLSCEKEPDGSFSFPNAPNNVKYLEELDRDMETILKTIYDAPILDE